MTVATASPAHRNDVHLIGRVSDAPEIKRLPSGDAVASFRLIVERSPMAMLRSRQRVDTLECFAWRAVVREIISTWSTGDVVEVRGSLRRRFWRTQGGLRNTYDVELFDALLVSKFEPPEPPKSEDPERDIDVESDAT
jgi:single-strand DNA-binding protein